MGAQVHQGLPRLALSTRTDAGVPPSATPRSIPGRSGRFGGALHRRAQPGETAKLRIKHVTDINPHDS
jgi:hypothetical protein